MEKIRLGRTGLMVSSMSFGALPIQRIGLDASKALLRKAYDNGINYFDTANSYSDSEEKIGRALSDVRRHIVISTKSMGKTRDEVLAHLQNSLRMMKTDYVDIMQLHNPDTLPDFDDPDSPWAGLEEAKKRGMTRFVGISSHRLMMAREAVESGRFDTLQYPFSMFSHENEQELVGLCHEKDVGFIAMKALSGGLVRNIPAAFAFIRRFPNVVPIWGIQHEWELDEFLALVNNPPADGAEIERMIEEDRAELGDSFCRGCGYCSPCTVDIPIYWNARIHLFARRSSTKSLFTEEGVNKILKNKECTECGVCMSRCPYGLNIPEMLKTSLKEFLEIYEEYRANNPQ